MQTQIHSSNINEVIRAVSNVLLFFLRKDFVHTKSTKQYEKYKKAQKAQKAPKNTKKYKSVNKRTKIKNAFKNIWVEKSNLFAYLRFSVFCAREQKKIENKKNEKSLQCTKSLQSLYKVSK